MDNQRRGRFTLYASVAVSLLVLSTPPASAADWHSRVREEIAAREYDITWQDQTTLADLPGAYQAPNRAHDFRTYFTRAGIRVVPRRDAKPSWEWGLSLLRYGRPGREITPPAAALSPRRNRIDQDRDGIVEWYANDPRGLEQGFTLLAPPPAPGGEGASDPFREVHIDLSLNGTLAPSFSADGQAIDFRAPGGAFVLRYSKLRVEDASGRALPARMEGFVEAGARGVRIAFDDQDAVYPVIVDPLATSPAWTAEGDQLSAGLFSVATAGDVNGDGYSDVVVGSSAYDNGEFNEGRAFVYLGSASGLATTAAWTAESDQAFAGLGVAVATAGDVNGDGYSDVIVGAQQYDNGETDEGGAFVYLGSGSGLAASPAWTAESDQANAFLGRAVATAGDVNGDGYSDVIVGAYFYDNVETDEGRAYVYLGSASGLAASPAWTAESDQASANLGISVATAGDVDGDGYSDVIVGAYSYTNDQPSEGRAYIYGGSASGLAASPTWTVESNVSGPAFGASVATAGDVNGDGYSDVLVGAYLYTNGQASEGRAFAYLGSASGLATSPGWTAESDQASANFGSSVAAAGDINGDGYADVIVGSYTYDNGEADEGQAFLYLGSAAGLAAAPAWTAQGDQASAWFGRSVATAGDVNGDGYSDVLVGAQLFDNGQTDEGRAFLYLGSASGLTTSPGWAAESNQSGSAYGFSAGTAGDVNGDGYSDVIAGAYLYSNGQGNEGAAFAHLGSASGLAAAPGWTAEGNQASANFGSSVAMAGDVNGDGYSDVIVGSYTYDNGQADEGQTFLYLGSVSGLATSPAWTAQGDQATAWFGRSVATAGDVNGDGYADVIVSAQLFDNGQTNEGKAFLYLGSAVGVAAAPAWTAESNQANASLFSVATAGDVNGDGYSDVSVGSVGYSNGQTSEGRAFVYLGSASGLATTAAWTAESDQAFGGLGISVGTAGDVNGDGYSDVIVGAQQYDNVEADEGGAFVYLGSGSGLATSPAWTGESDQANAFYGRVAATAGDVNGDGYSDVIVGAYLYDNVEADEGRAYVYLGSASGLAAAPAWIAESDQAGSNLGISVATAGDVNGDGYSDVIVGAYLHDNDTTNEGRVFVYYGNGGDGLDRAPSQARADGTAPIGFLGRSDSDTSFRLRALGRTPMGRGQVHLEMEVKPLGTSFDGSGTQLGAALDTGAPVPGSGSTVSLEETVAGLTVLTPYHWRLRLVSDSPFFPRSPWFSLPYNNRTEMDLRTDNGCPDADEDGYGAPGGPTCPAGTQTDCDDGNFSIHPGAVEICDGLDNDCDVTVDNAPVPAGSPEATAAESGADVLLSWTTIAGATGYDVVRGGLGALRSSAGNFTTAVDECTADNLPAASVTATGTVTSRNGYFYLVRAVNCGGNGSYDSGAPSQVGLRDAEVDAAALACP